MRIAIVLAATLSICLALPSTAGVSIAGSGGPSGLTATTAEAWSIQRNGGVGHMAVVPYFSTQAGNAMLLSINNVDLVNGKAVKVRFRSAVNGDTLSDFTVLLAPGDLWTANIHQGPDGRSTLATDDLSCTLPANVRQAFSTARLPSSLDAADKASWTREGYIEIIAMADIPSAPVNDDMRSAVFDAVYNASFSQVPCAPSVLDALKNDPAGEATARALGLDTPSTGLAVNTTLINVEGASVSWPVPAVALTAVTAAGNAGRGRLVFSPQTAEPAPSIDLFSNDPLLRTPAGGGSGRLAALQSDLPDLSTPYTGSAAVQSGAPFAQTEQIGRMLAVQRLRNEVVLTPSIGARTDWVVTAPTRRYAIGVDYAGASRSVVTNQAPAGPSSFFVQPALPADAEFKHCTGTVMNPYDIRQGTRDPRVLDGMFIIPMPPTRLQCNGAEVLAGSPPGSSALSARSALVPLPANYTEGWIAIPTTGAGQGLPLVGGAYIFLRGPEVSGKSTNFGLYYPHAMN